MSSWFGSHFSFDQTVACKQKPGQLRGTAVARPWQELLEENQKKKAEGKGGIIRGGRVKEVEEEERGFEDL